MNLKQLILTQNKCYKAGVKFNPTGIMVHSTGANNPTLKRYVGPDDGLLGKNQYDNHWNQAKPGGSSICVHGFIGKLADGTVATYQTLPWDMRGWHSGRGVNGTANDTHIGFEICEDNKEDALYFSKVYWEAVELCAMLCKTHGIKPEKPYLIDHSEGHALGIASDHGDVKYWFTKHGKSMDAFRTDVSALLLAPAPTEKPTAPTEAALSGKPARVSKDCAAYADMKLLQKVGSIDVGDEIEYLGKINGVAAVIYPTAATRKIAFVAESLIVM